MMKVFATVAFGALFSISSVAQEKNPVDLDALLKQLETGTLLQNKQNAQREKEFAAKEAQQDAMLSDAKQNRKNELNA